MPGATTGDDVNKTISVLQNNLEKNQRIEMSSDRTYRIHIGFRVAYSSQQ